MRLIEKYKNWIKTFENLIGQFEYLDNKIFAKFPNIYYKDDSFKLRGKFQKLSILDLTSNDKLIEKVINPLIKIYEEI